MQFILEKDFTKFFEIADATTSDFFKSDKDFLPVFRRFHSFFTEELFSESFDVPPTAYLLAGNALILYLGGIRIAISGQAAAVFPIMRTALESSCYSFLIANDPTLEKIWIDRHDSGSARAKCRKRFGSAIRDSAKQISKVDFVSEGTDKWLIDAYNQSIDFGAHPNPKSVLRYVNFQEDYDDDHHYLGLVGLHGPDSFETRVSLLACIDIGQLIATVLTASLDELTESLSLSLIEINDLKEKLVSDIF